MENFEKTLLFWMRIIALLLWCLLLSFVFKNFGDDAGSTLIVVSVAAIAIYHAIRVVSMILRDKDSGN